VILLGVVQVSICSWISLREGKIPKNPILKETKYPLVFSTSVLPRKIITQKQTAGRLHSFAGAVRILQVFSLKKGKIMQQSIYFIFYIIFFLASPLKAMDKGRGYFQAHAEHCMQQSGISLYDLMLEFGIKFGDEIETISDCTAAWFRPNTVYTVARDAGGGSVYVAGPDETIKQASYIVGLKVPIWKTPKNKVT